MSTKAFKNEKLEEIKKSIAEAKVAIVSDYRGLTVAEITDLRRQLQKEGADLTVVKNTLAIKAVENSEYKPLAALLKGPSAIIFGYKDQAAPAKVLTQFIKKAKKTEIKGAVLEGNTLSPKDVQKLAELPSKEELYAKILGSINSPASGLVNTLNGVARALVRAVDEVRKQKEAAQS